ncbi:hypothetical protein PV325_003281 [Microctonus aethiopoides]|uniref:Uncharacterized protein n=1 Tax=Microctonus aethiopoides TaxID=144406 RepID=A0AA39FUQ5_9HYME|nr:hypothetical protein PV325_003281 [Microctonus aethiopoides]KAK0176192.1 hypothetical protein PV328_000351 [Microctonus aethiopoides]
MFQLIIFIGGLVGVALASPQWYNSGEFNSASGFGGHFGSGHHHVGGAPLGPDGRVVDTPEVQHLKSTHLAKLAEAAARAPKIQSHYDVHDGGFNDIFNGHNNHGSYEHSYDGPRYHGPPAPLGPDGRVVDTPEVEAAKAHHFQLFEAALKAAPVHSPHSSHSSDFSSGQSEYDSGSYNPAWDSPSYSKHF